MKSTGSVHKRLFDEVFITGSTKELLELTKMSDDDLYRAMGLAARESYATLSPSHDYLTSLNSGDVEGKSPFFFRHPKVEATSPTVYLHLPGDDLEAGRIVCDQLGATLDRVLCETVSESPLYGYKQEAVKLGMRCVEAISKDYPNLDGRIVKAYVALRTKQLFNMCTLW